MCSWCESQCFFLCKWRQRIASFYWWYHSNSEEYQTMLMAVAGQLCVLLTKFILCLYSKSLCAVCITRLLYMFLCADADSCEPPSWLSKEQGVIFHPELQAAQTELWSRTFIDLGWSPALYMCHILYQLHQPIGLDCSMEQKCDWLHSVCYWAYKKGDATVKFSGFVNFMAA